MANLLELPAFNDAGELHCVVESPRGSKAKFTYDPELGAFTLKRSLILGVTYPYDWGFIPSTAAPDGDPLDVMIFHDVPTFPGVVMACQPIGALLVTQKSHEHDGREPNHRLLVIPAGSEREHQWRDARQLPERVRRELEQFFLASTSLADKALQIFDWVGPEQARAIIDDGVKKFRK